MKTIWLKFRFRTKVSYLISFTWELSVAYMFRNFPYYYLSHDLSSFSANFAAKYSPKILARNLKFSPIFANCRGKNLAKISTTAYTLLTRTFALICITLCVHGKQCLSSTSVHKQLSFALLSFELYLKRWKNFYYFKPEE